MFNFILIVFTLFSLSSLAKNGAGGRGGGTGITCKDNKTITLEEYIVKKTSNQKINIPENRLAIPYWVFKSFGFKNIGLYRKWLKTWYKIGNYDDWSFTSVKSFHNFFSNEENVNVLKDWAGVAIDKSVSFELENDDKFFNFDKINCKKRQLSIIEDNTIKKVAKVDLDKKTKRILELHESFFLTGMSFFNHRFPIRTRNLLVAMLTKKKNLNLLIKDFPNASSSQVKKLLGIYSLAKTSLPFEPEKYSHLEFLPFSTPLRPKDAGQCPHKVIYIAESPEYISETSIFYSWFKETFTIKTRMLSIPNKETKHHFFNALKFKFKNLPHSKESNSTIGKFFIFKGNLRDLFPSLQEGSIGLEIIDSEYKYFPCTLQKELDEINNTQFINKLMLNIHSSSAHSNED